LIGAITSIIAAVFWALAAIAVRRSLQTSSPLTTVFATVVVNAVLLWPLALLFTNFEQVRIEGIMICVAAGILAPTMGRLLRFMAVEKLGVALTAPLVETIPIFGALLAISILGEVVTLQIGLGMLAVVMGAMVLVSREGMRFTRIGVMLSLGSAFIFAAADIVRKIAITAVNSPFLGAAVGVTVAIVSYIVFSFVVKQPIANPKTWTRFNYLSGILTGLALSSIFTALFVERVVIVQSLVATSPLFTLFFTWIFLRKLEHVTPFIFVAAIFIVIGSILVSTA
jgi:drug/metabolite transporter (DMT)-like permease